MSIDIDECAEQNTGCQYCENAYGGYECTCPEGFELGEDEKNCVGEFLHKYNCQFSIIACNYL